MARARARGERRRLDLPPLEDLHAVQASLMQVLQALLNDRVDRHLGGLLLYGLQQAATNIKSDDRFWEQTSRFELAHGEGATKYDGFEAEFDLPKGFDLETPPEVAFPETEPTTDISDERADLMEVTPLDIDLMETRQREGPEAVTRKLKQMDAAEDRRYRRAQAQLAHARHVVRAAAQNAARESRFAERAEAAHAAADAEERADATPASAAGATPLSASVADRVGEEPSRKDPQSAVVVSEVDAKASGRK